MPYRRTDSVTRRLAARHAAILKAAREIAAESGMEAVQIAPVAERAGIAAGTVYRYFASKTELVSALVTAVADGETAAIRRAAGAAPGPLSALVAAITTFAARTLRHRRLAWAVVAEPVEGDVETARLAYRRALTAEFQTRIATAIGTGHLPEQDARFAAPALVGVLLEGLLGPIAPEIVKDPRQLRYAVEAIALFALRGLGVVDARARGLVAQAALPALDDDPA